MAEESSSTERSQNIWAPWRIRYIEELAAGADGCFLCKYRDEPDDDEKNLVIWRGRRSFVVLNRFPYTGGHSMVAPYDHVGEMAGLDNETITEMILLLRDLQHLLASSIRAEGFNIGMNIGRCAGAGLPGHLHMHIVPRWGGDTNFMAVFGSVRVIPQSLKNLYAQLRKASDELQLPKLPPKEQ
ncbi:MAG: HIT domain-containing protein [Phycisphaerae bacterium]|nr:HIT domain-containing protein [Phycisphaerae bacterium]